MTVQSNLCPNSIGEKNNAIQYYDFYREHAH